MGLFYSVLLTDAKVCQINHEAGVGGSGTGNCRKGARGGGVSGPSIAWVLRASLLLGFGCGCGFE